MGRNFAVSLNNCHHLLLSLSHDNMICIVFVFCKSECVQCVVFIN